MVSKFQWSIPVIALIAIVIILASLFTLENLVVFNTLQAGNTITIKSQATFGNVSASLYKDIGATTPLSAIDWGKLDPGNSRTVTMYIKNEGTSSLTASFSYGNFTPSTVSQYVTYISDLSSSSLNAGRIRRFSITINVANGVSGIPSFTNDLVITIG
jgi:hypothetical protein